jgi:hypothetical protein
MGPTFNRCAAFTLALILPGLGSAAPVPARVVPELTAEPVLSAIARPETIPTAFREGEDLRFAIKWGVITGGHSSLRVQNIEAMDGRQAYHVVAEAHSSGLLNTMYQVNDRNEAWIEPQTPSTLRYARKIHEGKYRVEEEVVLDQSAHRFRQRHYRIDKNRTEVKEGEIPPNVLDVLGSFYYVRTLPLEVGKSYTIDVHSEDTVYPLVVKVTKRQKIHVKAGRFDCFVLEPQLRKNGIFISKGKKMEVFVTADERHMPVLLRAEVFIGHVAAELVSHRTVTPAEMVYLTQGEKTVDPADPVAAQ